VTERRHVNDLRAVGTCPLPLEPEAYADVTVTMATNVPIRDDD
jgi:hypothetical protein